jgi:hypothetical protein
MGDLLENFFIGIIVCLFSVYLFIEFVLPVLVIASCTLGPAGAASLYTWKQLHQNIKEQYRLTWMSTSTLAIIAFLTLFVTFTLLQKTDNWRQIFAVIYVVPVALFLTWATLWLWARSKTTHIRGEIKNLNGQHNKIKKEISQKKQAINRAKKTIDHQQQKYQEVLKHRSKHQDRISNICRNSADTRPTILTRDTMVTEAASIGIQELRQQIYLLRRTASQKNNLDEMKYHILSTTLIDRETGNASQTLQQKIVALQELEQRKQDLQTQRNTLQPTLRRARNTLNGQRITLD